MAKKVRSGLLPVAGGFSQTLSAGFEEPRDLATGKRGRRRQFRLKLSIDESYGPPQARRALAVARLADITAMRDALVTVGRGAQAAYLMRQAGRVAGDEEKFSFAIAAANVVMSRPSEKKSDACTRFDTWGKLARAWGSQELARLYPGAGFAKKSAKATDAPRIEYLCKFIENVPLATFNDEDYWRAMRPARARCKTDSTFKAYAQVCRRVLKIAVELRVIPAWPLSAVCKLPIVAKGEAPEFPFLYPEEYARLMRCVEIPIEYRVLWGFIIREGLRLGEAYRIRWEHLAQLPEQPGLRARWVLNVPQTKTGRALMFVLSAGTGEVLEALHRLRPELDGPFSWLTATNLKKAAADLRWHVELSGTTRERLLFTEGRLRRLREHDLRSTFVSACKLAGVDNETIAQHTGHESAAMIARYNRSKATIEHLGLAPYLPLAQAFGERALAGAAELGAGEGAPRQLGTGEPAAATHETTAAVHEPPGATHEAGAGAVTSPLQPHDGPGNGERSGEAFDWTRDGHGRPGAYVQIQFNPRAGTAAATHPIAARGVSSSPDATPAPADGGTAAPQGRPAGQLARERHRRDRGAPRAPSHAPESEGGAQGWTSSSGDGADLVHRAAAAALPACVHCGRIAEHVEGCPAALNSRNQCDPRCDPAPVGRGSPILGNGETSMISAECARGDSNSQAVRRRNLNPAFGDRRKQNPDNPGGEPVPDETGSDTGSHPGVTLPASPLELLQAAGRAYYEQRNWAALAAVQPLIDAEVARVAEAARAALPEPVRLEVVRARKGGAS